jgi:glycine cleavage system aminomethyltransferase T
VSELDPYAFMSAAAAENGVALRTPMERRHVAAGARIEERDGWRVAVYEAAEAELWVADVSHIGKLDVRADASELDDVTGGLAPGRAREDDGIWTLRLTPTHGYVLCPFTRVEPLRSAIGPAAIDATCGLAGVALAGPRWRDVMNRSSALDVRPSRFPPRRCMAGSVMRVPTLVLNDGDGVVMLVGWEYGEYFWDAILDAGATLGIAPVTAVAAARQRSLA